MSYYLHISISVGFEGQKRYAECMEEFTPFMAKHGWQLILGLTPFSGNLTEIIHIWKLEALDDYRKGLEALAANAHTLPCIAEFQRLVTDETISIKVKTAYSP